MRRWERRGTVTDVVQRSSVNRCTMVMVSVYCNWENHIIAGRSWRWKIHYDDESDCRAFDRRKDPRRLAFSGWNANHKPMNFSRKMISLNLTLSSRRRPIGSNIFLQMVIWVQMKFIAVWIMRASANELHGWRKRKWAFIAIRRNGDGIGVFSRKKVL